MVGISLTAEQIRAAPTEVRQWLEQQCAGLFAPDAAAPPHAEPRRLAQLTPGEAQAVLEQIENVLPVVSVFFELGRDAVGMAVGMARSMAGPGMRVLPLVEIARHARLQSAAQVVECLDVINDALRQVRQDPEAMICAIDREGRCFVSDATAHAVLTLWQGIVAARALQMPAKPEPEQAMQTALVS